MLRFVLADKINSVDSAERILSKYRNRKVEIKLGPTTFSANLLDAKAEDGALYVKFTWDHEGTDSGRARIDHMYRLIRAGIGKATRFQINTDAFFGLLSGSTELPEGATADDYADSPFALVFSFDAEDQVPIVQKTAGGKGSVILVKVPTNISDHLRVSPDLEYEPHITVAYFPSLDIDDVESVLRLAREAAKKTGQIDISFDGSTTFPTPQDDGTYPHVALVSSSGLTEFHNAFVDNAERFKPGIVDTTFAGKNYQPHTTLKYVDAPGVSTPVKSMSWTTDTLYLSYHGGKEFFPIPLTSVRTAAYFQLGEVRIPMEVQSKSGDELVLTLDSPSQGDILSSYEGRANLVSDKSDSEIEILEVSQQGTSFRVKYRPITSYVTAQAGLLRYVANIARERGLVDISERLSALLSFDEEESDDEDEDTEALGPGSPGVDPHIVTYVKAPQTQQIVEEPKFTRKMPLHERL